MNNSWIDWSQIYLLIFGSQIGSYSYSSHFHFMNWIPIKKYLNFTNIIPIHRYFCKAILNLYFEYICKLWKYTLWFCLLVKFFRMRNIYESGTWNNEKKMERKNISDICELFANTSRLMNTIPIPICKFWRRKKKKKKTILIPILTEVGEIAICWTPGIP